MLFLWKIKLTFFNSRDESLKEIFQKELKFIFAKHSFISYQQNLHFFLTNCYRNDDNLPEAEHLLCLACRIAMCKGHSARDITWYME